MKWIVGLVVSLAPVGAMAEPLELVCQGQAVKTVEDSSSVTVRNNEGDRSTGSVSSFRKVRSDERYRVRLDGAGAGSIKVPLALIPTLRSGGKDGWWPLVDLAVTDDQIAASYKLNILNKGKFKIDRRTGEIEMTALAMTFTGVCERATEAPEERKF